MAQKPMLRAEVYAHAMRASQNRKKEVRREKKIFCITPLSLLQVLANYRFLYFGILYYNTALAFPLPPRKCFEYCSTLN